MNNNLEEKLDMKKLINLISKEKKIPKRKKWKFWNTQLVPKLNATGLSGPVATNNSAIVNGKILVRDIRQEPYNLPKGFEWTTININDITGINEVYTLLNNNYVEDNDNIFRFNYSIDFLYWALKPPGYFPEWHIGVRQTNNKRLLAFISGVPAKIRIYDADPIQVAEINFLCIHKKLRSKRLTPVLIKEISRRVKLKNIWQAVYTTGIVIPKPLVKCQYWHRFINPKKLITVGFSSLAPKMTMKRTIRLYKLPEKTVIPGFRIMVEQDIPAVHKLLTNYLKNFTLACDFSIEEVAHILLPRKNVIDTFVVEDPNSGIITDLCSFYHLSSSIIGNKDYDTLNVAYSYYNVATSVSLSDLITDLLVIVRDRNFDVFNMLDIMENSKIIKDLKFAPGTGRLYYYLFNWRCNKMTSDKIGLVLL